MDVWTVFSAGIGIALLYLARAVLRRTRRGPGPLAVLDGSNVMHWKDNAPDTAPLIQTISLLRGRGYRVGIVFDANAGYKLAGRYQDDRHLAALLGLPESDVLVVPKGEQADPFLLRYASDSGAVLVSNDRFRDRIAEFSALQGSGRLVRGGWREGRVWLDLP